MTRCWRLDTPSQTMVLSSFDGGLPEVVYWSAPLPEDEDLATLAAAGRRAATGGALDSVAPLSVAPEAALGFMGHPGILAGGAGQAGTYAFESAEEGGGRLSVLCRNPAARTAYAFRATAHADSDVIALTATLHNEAAEPARLDWIAAPVLPAPAASDHTIELSGRWCGEFRPVPVAWAPGARLRESREGRTSHSDFPGLLIPCRGATETGGEAWGLHLAWSGGHRMLAEELPDGRRQVQFGALDPSGVTIPAGGAAETPALLATRSGEGLNGVSHAFHRHARAHVLNFPRPEAPRPVHYNCWEAVYFDHDPQVLAELASRAAALGAERFVLDDGWFGRRDDDRAGLGDWEVDTRKWPDGLTPLIEHVKSLGMSFGLWVEPEMVNEDSDLYRAHPGWAGTGAVKGRQQDVLRLDIPEVREHLFDRLDALLGAHDIGYLKWDHNRPLVGAFPDQTVHLYDLLDRLRRAHPSVEIETCASGGARADFGILARTHRFWASDSNDALERWSIQRGASYFFPPEITGAHAGPRVCHTSGRQLSMAFRAAVAGTRAMGLEMDLREMTDAEAAEATAAIARFKARRALLHSGRLHRLESADPALEAEMHVAGDGAGFVLFAAQLRASAQTTARPLRLAGLAPEARYRLQLEAPGAVPDSLNRGPRNPLVAGAPVTLSGRALMQAGVQLPTGFPETLWTINGERL